METGKRSRFGRFFWLFLLIVALGSLLAAGITSRLGDLRAIGLFLLIELPFQFIGMILYRKTLESDDKNNISTRPWPRAAIGLVVLCLVAALLYVPIAAYNYFPCSGVDIVRKLNGCVDHISLQGSVYGIAFSKDGKVFATSDPEGNVKVWSYPSLALLNDLGKRGRWMIHFSLSSKGDLIAICDGKGSIAIVDIATGQTRRTLTQNDSQSCDLRFTPDDQSIVSISGSELQIWDVATGSLIQSIQQDQPSLLDISPDGSFLAIGTGQGKIDILRALDGTRLATMHQSGLQAVAISYDGKHLLAGSVDLSSLVSPAGQDDTPNPNSTLSVWNTKTGELEHTIQLPGYWLQGLSASRTGDGLVIIPESCLPDSLLEKPCTSFLHWTNGDQIEGIRVRYGATAAAFSPSDGKILIGGYKELYVWRTP